MAAVEVEIVLIVRIWEPNGPILVLVLGHFWRRGLMMEEAGRMVIVVRDRLSHLSGVDPFVRWLDGPLS